MSGAITSPRHIAWGVKRGVIAGGSLAIIIGIADLLLNLGVGFFGLSVLTTLMCYPFFGAWVGLVVGVFRRKITSPQSASAVGVAALMPIWIFALFALGVFEGFWASLAAGIAFGLVSGAIGGPLILELSANFKRRRIRRESSGQ